MLLRKIFGSPKPTPMKNPNDSIGEKSKLFYERMWEENEKTLGEQFLDSSEYSTINDGIPSKRMLNHMQADKRGHMAWFKLIEAGACSPLYAAEKQVSQLTNMAVITTLIAGFSLSFVASMPEFPDKDEFPFPLSEILTHLYGLLLLFAGVSSLSATLIALHSMNHIGNALPSKSSMSYMTKNIFYDARDSLRKCIFISVICLLLALSVNILLTYAGTCYGIPAFSIAIITSLFVIDINNTWYWGTRMHSTFADQLFAQDFIRCAENNASMSAAIIHS